MNNSESKDFLTDTNTRVHAHTGMLLSRDDRNTELG